MAKPIVSNEELATRLKTYKDILLSKFSDVLIEDEVNSAILLHKSSKSPRQFLLFVSLHPKLSKFILGVKSFNKEDREKIVSVYDNLPLDQKGRLHDALKYVSITNEIKFESVDADVLRLVENTLAFYAENFKDSLN